MKNSASMPNLDDKQNPNINSEVNTDSIPHITVEEIKEVLALRNKLRAQGLSETDIDEEMYAS